MDKEIRENRILRYPLLALSNAGFMSFKDQTFPVITRWFGYFVIIMHYIYNAGQVIFAFVHSDDVNLVATNSGTAALILSIHVKCSSFLVYRVKYRKMCATIHAGMKQIEEEGVDAEKSIINRSTGIFLKLVWALQITTTITCSLYILYFATLFFIFHEPGEAIHPLSMESWFPFEISEHRIFCFCFYSFFLSVNSFMIPHVNTIIMALFVYANCMLRILQYKIRNPDVYISKLKRDTNEITHKERYEFMIHCIKEHLKIIEFLEDIKEVIAFPMGIDFLINVMIFCIEGRIASKMSYGVELVFTAGYISVIFCMALFFYWYASETVKEEKELANAAFDSPWTDNSSDYKRAVIFMIQRSQKSITFRAGILPMSMDTFIAILRISYSAFMILRSLD